MMRLSLHERYLLREVLAAVLLVLAAFIALFSFFEFIDELRDLGRGGYGVVDALVFVALSLPGLVYELLPIATLIGALYALSTLARHSELTVFRASGLSTRALLLTLFKGGALIALLTLVVGEGVMPYAERTAQEIRAKAMSKVIAQAGMTTGLWIKDGRNFINIRQAMPDATLEGIRIYSFNDRSELTSVIAAQHATFEPPGLWRLEDVEKTLLDGDVASISTEKADLWQSAVTPDLLAVLMVSPERMSLNDLIRYTGHLSENRQKTERYEIAIWKKLIYPLTALVMMALALPFGYSHDRVGGVSLKIFTGVILGISFYALNGLFSNLGVINAWPAFASAVAPSAMFLVGASFMLWWVERR